MQWKYTHNWPNSKLTQNRYRKLGQRLKCRKSPDAKRWLPIIAYSNIAHPCLSSQQRVMRRTHCENYWVLNLNLKEQIVTVFKWWRYKSHRNLSREWSAYSPTMCIVVFHTAPNGPGVETGGLRQLLFRRSVRGHDYNKNFSISLSALSLQTLSCTSDKNRKVV